ncbi:gp337 [Bacillus phage G]|uniref:Gp337 n=1 Tax=Bacillus phage G TaxID=2884420 RepID=G3MA78_9CAUD|nr:gp337 [Bacillus phage G]AEO93596.1 gp337 [Bacillus phage G]
MKNNWVIPKMCSSLLNIESMPKEIDELITTYRKHLKELGFNTSDSIIIESYLSMVQITFNIYGKGKIKSRGNNFLYKFNNKNLKKAPLFGYEISDNNETFVMGADSRYKPTDIVFTINFKNKVNDEQELIEKTIDNLKAIDKDYFEILLSI